MDNSSDDLEKKCTNKDSDKDVYIPFIYDSRKSMLYNSVNNFVRVYMLGTLLMHALFGTLKDSPDSLAERPSFNTRPATHHVLTDCKEKPYFNGNDTLSNIVLNLEDEKRTIIPKNEEEGIKDMRTLLDTSIYEEAWAYLPEKKEWHEIGVDEYTTNCGNYIESGVDKDIEYIDDKLAKSNKKITVWHFHPDSANLHNKVTKQPIQNEKPIGVNDSGKPLNYSDGDITYKTLKSAFRGKSNAAPSPTDLLNAIARGYTLYEVDSTIEYKEKLASQYGITEFRMTEHARDYLNANDGYLDLTIPLVTENASIKHMADNSIFISSDWVQIKFTPYCKDKQ
ncbi:hypothetical protein KY345_02900 [Candidatus Woesearchaeota archaeon]|nr:hypothetical protein [Candidatus Woesearchaeota archaeon]